MKNFYYKISDFLSPKVLAVLFMSITGLSLLPILYLSLWVRASGDDLGYSAKLHHVMENGGSLTDAMKAMGSVVATSYKGYQGTWSSLFLFQLQPGLLGDRFYGLTILIALFFLMGGTFYLLRVLLVRHYNQRKELFWIIFASLSFFMIQYMPKVRGGLFWYTSVAHYCIPYGMCMFCMGWSIQYLDTFRKRYFVGILLGMIYLGGAGYPEVVLAAVWFFFLIGYVICGSILHKKEIKDTQYDKKTKAALLLLIPFILELSGFVVSALAPGNKGRGGEGFGFSGSNVIYTLAESCKEGITEGIRYFVYARPLFLLPLIVIVFTWELYDPSCNKKPIKHPILALEAAYIVSSMVRAPAIYAAVSVSGGVPDSEYFTFLIMLVMGLFLATASFKQQRMEKSADMTLSRSSWFSDPRMFVLRLRTPFVLLALLFCCIFAKHLIGTSVDYTCVKFITTGQLEDYKEQMTEWLSILEDDSVRDAKLPQMNSEQGPYMIMVPLETDDAFSNYAYETYFNKDSVITIPRN